MRGAPAVGVGRVLVGAERAGAARDPRVAKRRQSRRVFSAGGSLPLLRLRLLVEHGLDEREADAGVSGRADEVGFGVSVARTNMKRNVERPKTKQANRNAATHGTSAGRPNRQAGGRSAIPRENTRSRF